MAPSAAGATNGWCAHFFEAREAVGWTSGRHPAKVPDTAGRVSSARAGLRASVLAAGLFSEEFARGLWTGSTHWCFGRSRSKVASGATGRLSLGASGCLVIWMSWGCYSRGDWGVRRSAACHRRFRAFGVGSRMRLSFEGGWRGRVLVTCPWTERCPWRWVRA